MTRAPLPILETVAAAYATLIENFLAFLQAAGGWFALSLVVTLGLAQVAETSAQHQVAVAVSIIVGAVANVAVAVSWHRLVLLSEQPAGPVPFQLQPSLAYFGRSLILFATVAVAGIIISGALWLSRSVEIVLPLIAVSYVSIVLVISRIILTLPAAAIGERRMTLKASWAFTAHNSWRMFAGLSLSFVPLTFVSALVQASVVGDHARMLVAVLGVALLFLNVAIVAGFASFVYRHFTQSEGSTAWCVAP